RRRRNPTARTLVRGGGTETTTMITRARRARTAATGTTATTVTMDLVPARPAEATSGFRRRFRRPKVGSPEILTRRLRRELERQAPGEQVRFCLRGDLGHALVCLED